MRRNVYDAPETEGLSAEEERLSAEKEDKLPTDCAAINGRWKLVCACWRVGSLCVRVSVLAACVCACWRVGSLCVVLAACRPGQDVLAA